MRNDEGMHQHRSDHVEQLDENLAALARGEAGLRLRLGQVLEVLSRGGVFELGFSSVGAYSIERCERGARWAEVARRLARQAESLPALRQRIATGQISWSMGELLARVARPADEERWLERARGRTVRQMRALVAEAGAHPATGAGGTCADAPELPAELVESCGSSREICTLECTVSREDAWLFEATRLLLEHLGACGVDGMDALLAEAHGTLLARLPKGAIELEQLLASDAARQRWLLQLAVWRDEAEAVCEKKNGGWRHAQRGPAELDVALGAVAIAASRGMAPIEGCRCDELDAMVRALARGLARHELDFARLLVAFHRANGWRLLGYASETQYARERLGLSRSAVLARRALAVRLEKLPGIAAALGQGEIGIEAALQLVRVATPRTELMWLAQARRRTIKHLREEVAAAQVAICCSKEADCPPPLEGELDAFHDLERAVVGGRVGSSAPDSDGGPEAPARSEALGAEAASPSRRPWQVTLRSLASWLRGEPGEGEGEVQPSASGRVTLRLRFSSDAAAWWRRLAEVAVPHLPPGMSWLRFSCLSLWRAWQHELEHDVAYGRVYIRDRFRCISPVCHRRDVTPHHLRFRSAGGSDDDANIGSLCTWCHLLGVHGGRIRARGAAGHIHWELGPARSPCVVVHGRDRMVA